MLKTLSWNAGNRMLQKHSSQIQNTTKMRDSRNVLELIRTDSRKTRRKATRRNFTGGKLVIRIENNPRQI